MNKLYYLSGLCTAAVHRKALLLGPALALLSGCSPDVVADDGGDASRAVDVVAMDRGPRDTGVDFFDAVEPGRDGTFMQDVPNPTTCEGWCAFRLTECGTPARIALELCAGRCGTSMTPNASIPCLREARCVDLSNAIARGVSICDLDPVLDSGIAPDRPDPPRDVPNARDVPNDMPNARDVPNDMPNVRDVPSDMPNARDVPSDMPNARDVPTDVRG